MAVELHKINIAKRVVQVLALYAIVCAILPVVLVFDALTGPVTGVGLAFGVVALTAAATPFIALKLLRQLAGETLKRTKAKQLALFGAAMMLFTTIFWGILFALSDIFRINFFHFELPELMSIFLLVGLPTLTCLWVTIFFVNVAMYGTQFSGELSQ